PLLATQRPALLLVRPGRLALHGAAHHREAGRRDPRARRADGLAEGGPRRDAAAGGRADAPLRERAGRGGLALVARTPTPGAGEGAGRGAADVRAERAREGRVQRAPALEPRRRDRRDSLRDDPEPHREPR